MLLYGEIDVPLPFAPSAWTAKIRMGNNPQLIGSFEPHILPENGTASLT